MVAALHCALAGLALFVGYKAMQPKEKPKPEKCKFLMAQHLPECAGDPPTSDYGVKQGGNRKSVQEEMKNAIAPPYFAKYGCKAGEQVGVGPDGAKCYAQHSGKRDDAGREKPMPTSGPSAHHVWLS